MSHIRRLVLSPGTTLFAEGGVLTHIFLIDSGEIRILMNHPTNLDADPIDCATFGPNVALGIEVLRAEAGQTPLAPFTAMVLPDAKPCMVSCFTREGYLKAIGPGSRANLERWIFRPYEQRLRDVLQWRDRIARKRKSGPLERIVAKGASIDGLDWDEDLPDTKPDIKNEKVG
jgi:hypothetical protein